MATLYLQVMTEGILKVHGCINIMGTITFHILLTTTIVYAISKSPKGPFVYKGRILNPVIDGLLYHSIVEFEGKWYLFYHDSSLSGGADNRRCVKFTEIKYNDDELFKQ